MADDFHDDVKPGTAQAVISAQYDLPFAGGGRERSRGIDGARPAAELVYPQADMFYDNSQRVYAAMVEDASASAICGDADRAALIERLDVILAERQSSTIQIVDAWPRQAAPVQRYRPSFLIDYLVPAGRAQDMHANLEEIYPRWVARHGACKAGWIKAMQVFLLISGTWLEKGLAIAERLLKVMRFSG